MQTFLDPFHANAPQNSGLMDSLPFGSNPMKTGLFKECGFVQERGCNTPVLCTFLDAWLFFKELIAHNPSDVLCIKPTSL